MNIIDELGSTVKYNIHEVLNNHIVISIFNFDDLCKLNVKLKELGMPTVTDHVWEKNKGQLGINIESTMYGDVRTIYGNLSYYKEHHAFKYKFISLSQIDWR